MRRICGPGAVRVCMDCCPASGCTEPCNWAALFGDYIGIQKKTTPKRPHPADSLTWLTCSHYNSSRCRISPANLEHPDGPGLARPALHEPRTRDTSGPRRNMIPSTRRCSIAEPANKPLQPANGCSWSCRAAISTSIFAPIAARRLVQKRKRSNQSPASSRHSPFHQPITRVVFHLSLVIPAPSGSPETH